MTLSTSAVAVCCCSDFAQLVEQAGVLDGDDGLGGEVRDQLDLLVGERPDLLAVDDDGADQLVVLEHRTADQWSARRRSAAATRQRIPFDAYCSDVAISTSASLRATRPSGRSPGRGRTTAPLRRLLDKGRRRIVHAQPRGMQSPRQTEQCTELGLADTRSRSPAWPGTPARSSPGELADDLQHLGGRGLLLQRLVARACAPAPRRTAARSRSQSPPGRRRS